MTTFGDVVPGRTVFASLLHETAIVIHLEVNIFFVVVDLETFY